MAQKQLLQLPKTQFSGLEFSNILEDVYNLVRENPDYNESWDDFLSSNAGVMLTEIFAWITDQLATRIDWVVNENFIGTATQRESIINLLKLIGYKFKLPVAAEVPVDVSFLADVGTFTFTDGYNVSTGTYTPKTITAKDKKGNTKFFEAVYYDSSVQEYIYETTVEVDTSTSTEYTVNFYEGQTKIENFVSITNQGQVFSLSENPVIRNSIKVFLIENLGTVESPNYQQTELLEVDSFLNLKAQQELNADGTTNEIPYVINVLEDDAVEVAFGSASLISDIDRRLSEGSDIRIIYRIGGGIDGNIARHAISYSEEIDTTITYVNKTEGVGSEDSETIEHAAYSGPLQIKTAGKTVTEEDYDIILSSFVNVLLSKAYGHNNIPSDFYSKYGIYISPLEVLNFVIMKKSGWEEVPTSKYKYANWGTFNLENYFNEKIAFNDGVFGTPLVVNSNSTLKLSEEYDHDNQGGRVFRNYMVISTPTGWKESIFIENPDNADVLDPLLDTGELTGDYLDYIANPDLKASLTTVDYDSEDHQLLENITPHFITDNDSDPYFYGDYNESGLPKQEITEDINAYFQSKKDVSLGVYIGASGDPNADPNLLNLNIDGHGEVEVNLGVFGLQDGTVDLSKDGGGDAYPAENNTIIHAINTQIADAYNDIFSYHDFGILIEDTTEQVPALELIEEQDWTLRVGDVDIDPEHYIDFDVNTGVDQSYDNFIIYMNNGFAAMGTSGYQYLENTATVPYTVVDGREYNFNINLNETGIVNVVLVPAAGITTNTLTVDELVEMLNDAFRLADMKANAKNVSDDIMISSNETGSTTSIDLTAGTTAGNLYDLLALVGGVETAVDGTGVIGCNLEASFVDSISNIACKDIRISRTNITGKVLLSDSAITEDILTGFGAIPLTEDPVDWGDYSEIATVVSDGEDERYIRLESPNTGTNSGIVIKESTAGASRDATLSAFGLDYEADFATGVDRKYECFGQRKLTIIYADTEQSDFGDFIYEHGSIHFNSDDPQYIWLNYISSKKDTVRLGSYYTDNFEDTDPEWKPAAHRIYNTIYKLDTDSEIQDTEAIDYDVSNMLVEFTKNEIVDNSIYVINNGEVGNINTELALEVTDYPTITSINLIAMDNGGTPDTGTTGTEKYIKISINENAAPSPVDITGFNTVAQLITVLNTIWGTEANEVENLGIDFATIDPEDSNKIILTIDNKTNTGRIVIYDDADNLLGADIFGTATGENTAIYPSGDYYLEHAIDDPSGTLEEQFGYFNMKINQNSINLIPDLSFYAHFVDDRRHEFLLNINNEIEQVYSVHTDEDDLINLLQPYKIAGVENSFKRPVFSTFDCRANIYLSSSASKEQVKQNVDTALRDFYSLENTILSENVNKSEFIGTVLDVSGVRYIDITYFGKDAENEIDNQDLEIESGFDEILVLSDDVFGESGVQTNGLIFQYSTL